MQTVTTTAAPAAVTIPVDHDPVMARELFLANWDLMELTLTIPQADAPVTVQNVY